MIFYRIIYSNENWCQQSIIFCLLMALGFYFVGCHPKVIPPDKRFIELTNPEAENIVQRISLKEQGLSSWKDLESSLKHSLAYVTAQNKNEPVLNRYGLKITWGKLKITLERFISLLDQFDEDPLLLARCFKWYELRPLPLFTGYYEPQLEASLEPRPGYVHPIYGLPNDLKVADLGRFHPRWEGEKLVYRVNNGTVEPYFDRESIEEEGSLYGKAPILAWVKNELDIFFLQIQGSGRLVLPDGKIKRIGYAGKNGREYVSLGRSMVDRGFLEKEDLSMQSIRNYLENNKELLPEILYTNPSYVFFRFLDKGPCGAIGKSITPRLSLATDPKVLPLGSILVFTVDLPAEHSEDTTHLTGLGLAQDVGGAIKGHHLDLFLGSGNRAKYQAGHLKDLGRVYILLANNDMSFEPCLEKE